MTLTELIDKILPITAVDKDCKIRLNAKLIQREKAAEYIATYVAQQLPALNKYLYEQDATTGDKKAVE